MADGPAIVLCKLKRHCKAFVQRADGRVVRDEPIGLVGNDLRQQRGDILKMIVKGITVDAAVLHDIPDADSVQRLFIEQLEK